jgi:glutaredoxin-dependent peroxiredoxin
MLEAGALVPGTARVWRAPREDAVSLTEALGPGLVLLCFYVFDWSPTWTNELLLLRDRGDDLRTAGIRPFGISCDSPWSHRTWAEALGTGAAVLLLSDWAGEAARGFGVETESAGMRVAARSAFLLEDGTVRAAWMLGPDLPDLDAVIAAAPSPSSSRAP